MFLAQVGVIGLFLLGFTLIINCTPFVFDEREVFYF